MTALSLLFVDDHAFVREGFITYIRQHWNEIGAIWEARSLGEGLRAFAVNRPTMVLLDINFDQGWKLDEEEPSRDGIDAIAKFKAIDPNVCIIILSQYKGYSIQRARQAGANGYLIKDWHYDHVLAEMQAIVQGKSVFPSYSNRLTTRECEILRLMSLGLADKQIAIELGIHYLTVRSHIKNIFAELDVQSKQAAISRARELCILP